MVLDNSDCCNEVDVGCDNECYNMIDIGIRWY